MEVGRGNDGTQRRGVGGHKQPSPPSHTIVYYKLLVDMYLVHSIEGCAGAKG